MFKNLTGRQLHALRELDTAVYSGAKVKISTQFGDVGVRTAGVLGYAADLNPDAEIPGETAYGATPAIALLTLRDLLLSRYKTASVAKIISFPAEKLNQSA